MRPDHVRGCGIGSWAWNAAFSERPRAAGLQQAGCPAFVSFQTDRRARHDRVLGRGSRVGIVTITFGWWHLRCPQAWSVGLTRRLDALGQPVAVASWVTSSTSLLEATLVVLSKVTVFVVRHAVCSPEYRHFKIKLSHHS